MTVQQRSVNPWVVLALVCIPVFIGALDLTIVSAFLPEIIIKLELPVETILDDAAWVVTGYLLAYTISMTFMGRVSDLAGRRVTYIICLLIFMLGSFIVAEVDPQAREGFAGLLYNLSYRIQGTRPEPGSVALATIVIGRVVQALGAGALVPISLALVGDLFPAARRAQPLGIIGAVDTLGWVLGHLYGGIMVNWFSSSSQGFVDFFASLGLNWGAPDWRALFWINIPITLVALALTWWVLRGAQQERARGRFDFVGTLLISGTLICLVVGLGANIEISANTANFEDLGGLPPYALPVLVAGLVMLVLFVVHERRAGDPLFDIGIFRRRSLAMGSLTNLFVGFCLMAGLVSVPILVNIRIEDASHLAEAALQVGILLSALTVPMALAAVPGGWLSDRLGASRVTALGLALAGVGFAAVWQTWTLEVADTVIALEMALIGIGLGLTFSPISASVINAADPDKLGVASALVIIMRLLGMTIGVSLLTAFSSQRLALLASSALGQQAADPFAALETYSRLTVQVLTEIAFLSMIVCLIALIPALRIRSGSASPQQADERVFETGD